jgi:hypothetical protein
MQETTKKDDFWGFDPDLSCLSLCAIYDVDNNSHQVGFPNIQATSHAIAQQIQPETKLVKTKGASFPATNVQLVKTAKNLNDL